MQEAREEVEQILADAKAQADGTRAQAEAEANARRDTILQRARREADALRDQTIAKAQMEAQTLKLGRREELLSRPFAEVRRQLASATQWQDYGQIARQLIREGVERLGGGEIVVRADEETRKVLDDETLEALGQELDARLLAGELLDKGTGVVLETPDGHRRYDNTLETRLTRMQDALRTPVYHILMGETA